MTNHPDETHTLRERVDEAISWFTGTDEPVEEPVAEEAPAEPVAEEAPVEAVVPAEVLTDQTEELPDGQLVPAAEVSADEPPAVEPVTEPAPVDVQPVADAEPVDEDPDATVLRPAPVPDQPIAPATTWPPVNFPKPATPQSAVEPEADVQPEPEPYTTPQRAMEPVVAEPEAVDAAPLATPVAAEVPIAEPEPVAEVVPEPEPVETPEHDVAGIESSDVDEPTRIHPIDESLGLPVEFDSGTLAEPPAEPVEDEPAAQRSFFRDEAPTMAMGAGALGVGAAAAAVPATEKTAVLDAQEAARLRREERAARDRQLGKVIASSDDDEPLVTPFTTPSTYKGLPSFGFLLFRLVIAAVVGIRAWQHLTHLTATRQMWAATVLPSPETMAWVQIIAEITIAVMLVIGLGTRIAGLALVALSVLLLAFVQWGAVNPFQPNATDFIGIVDVLLVGAGLLLASVGGGRAAVDGAIHVGHVRRKNNKLFA